MTDARYEVIKVQGIVSKNINSKQFEDYGFAAQMKGLKANGQRVSMDRRRISIDGFGIWVSG